MEVRKELQPGPGLDVVEGEEEETEKEISNPTSFFEDLKDSYLETSDVSVESLYQISPAMIKLQFLKEENRDLKLDLADLTLKHLTDIRFKN